MPGQMRVAEAQAMPGRRILLGMVTLAALAPGLSQAAEYGSREEAMAMVARAISLLEAEGDAALPKLSDRQGRFVDRDLYIVVFDHTVTIRAHGFNNRLIGVNMTESRDPDGVPFAQLIVRSGQSNPEGGWVNFKFTNPVTRKIEPKAMFVRRSGNYIVCCGVYSA